MEPLRQSLPRREILALEMLRGISNITTRLLLREGANGDLKQ